MRFRWTPRAKRELDEARAWYRGVGPSIARRFAAAVQRAVSRVSVDPTSWEVVGSGRDVRRCPVLGFPYDLLFVAGDDEVEVLSVWHHHRDPADRPF